MLLHSTYINVAIAVILSEKLSLYDLQGRIYEFHHMRLRSYMGVALLSFPQGKNFCSDRKTLV